MRCQCYASQVSYVADKAVEADQNSVSVTFLALKLAVFLVLVTAVIVKHSFGLISVTAETTTRFWCVPKLSIIGSLASLQLCC